MIWKLIGGFTGIFRLAAGAVVAFGLFSAWNTIWDNPRVRDDARRQYVAIAVLEAEKAKSKELERQRNAGAIAFEEYRKRLAAAELVEAQTEQRHEQEIAEMERRVLAAGTAWLLDEADKEFLERR